MIHAQPDPDLRSGYVVSDLEAEREMTIYYPAAHSLRKFKAYKEALDHGYEIITKRLGKPQLIHSHFTLHAGRVALRWKREKALPYIITEHSTNFSTSNPSLKIKILRILAQAALKSASKVLPVSQDLANHLGVSVDRYEVVPNAVKEDFFKERKSNSTKTIIHVSSFDEDQKNMSGMLRAFQSIKQPYRLILIGTDNHDRIHELIKKYHLPSEQISVLGPASNEEVAQHILSSDIFVLFSRYENLPCVLLEALCAGVYCIATEVGGVREIIDQKELGVTISSEDEAALSKAIDSALNLEIKHKKIRTIAAEKYASSIIRTQIQSIYNQVINGNK